MSDYFRAAYDRTRARFSEEQWLALDPRQITDAIYREMRRMDAETVAAGQTGQPDSKPSDPSEG